MTRKIIKFLKPGRLKYQTGLELQKIFSSRHQQPNFPNPNSLILCEHDPVYTIGIRDKNYSSEDETKLRKLGAEFYKTNRGGLITFHGPGQLVAYPIINMRDFQTSVKCYVEKIEKMIIRLCAEFGIKAGTSVHTGVWVEDRKICAIGIRASRYVTTHGLALNCNTDLGWFEHIVPCGIEGKEVTSISKELGVEVKVQDVVPYFLRAFGDEFGAEVEDLGEGEVFDMLRRVRIQDK